MDGDGCWLSSVHMSGGRCRMTIDCPTRITREMDGVKCKSRLVGNSGFNLGLSIWFGPCCLVFNSWFLMLQLTAYKLLGNIILKNIISHRILQIIVQAIYILAFTRDVHWQYLFMKCTILSQWPVILSMTSTVAAPLQCHREQTYDITLGRGSIGQFQYPITRYLFNKHSFSRYDTLASQWHIWLVNPQICHVATSCSGRHADYVFWLISFLQWLIVDFFIETCAAWLFRKTLT